MVRELFRVAEEHAPSIVFIDEIDAVGTKRYIQCILQLISQTKHAEMIFVRFTVLLSFDVGISINRYDSNSGGEREIQRTMLELLNQLDGFDSRGDVKVCVFIVLQINI